MKYNYITILYYIIIFYYYYYINIILYYIIILYVITRVFNLYTFVDRFFNFFLQYH